MSRILVPDLVTNNFNTLSFQRDVDVLGYKTIADYNKDRDDFTDATKRKMVKFNSKDLEDFPYKYVLTGIQEINNFNKSFFSKLNIDWIQSNIRYKVYELSKGKTVISRQKDSEVLEAMRRIYLQNSINPENILDMKKEMLRLNTMVLNDTVPRILSEVAQYKKYLEDIAQVRTPIKLPVNSSVTGTKIYERGPADVLGLFV